SNPEAPTIFEIASRCRGLQCEGSCYQMELIINEPLAQAVEQRATHLPNKLRVTPKHRPSSKLLADAGVFNVKVLVIKWN
ncbi:MAG TPA: hypothetical protein VF095_05845, partial [Bacillota bacterium]